jgi:hypothetical protein
MVLFSSFQSDLSEGAEGVEKGEEQSWMKPGTREVT